MNAKEVEPTKHNCFDAYQLGGHWVVIKCLGCSYVARVKVVALPNTCQN